MPTRLSVPRPCEPMRPLAPEISGTINQTGLVAAAVLSGNRNSLRPSPKSCTLTSTRWRGAGDDGDEDVAMAEVEVAAREGALLARNAVENARSLSSPGSRSPKPWRSRTDVGQRDAGFERHWGRGAGEGPQDAVLGQGLA